MFRMVLQLGLLTFSIGTAQAFPSYCENPAYQNVPACQGSGPAYCENPAYQNVPACKGSGPDYCENPAYQNAPACGPKLDFKH